MNPLPAMDLEYLKNYAGRPLKLMEVCGTHTAAIFRSGIRDILPPGIELISGPGCPVCVTAQGYIDMCIELAMKPNCALVSFGDMFKVPGSSGNLSAARAAGGRVIMVYSPFEVISMAEAEPDTEFVVAAVGFETTAPAYGLLLDELTGRGIRNVRLVTALKSAIKAIDWVLDTGPEIDGLICPGHVSVITGSGVYEPIARKHHRPCVVAGFEPVHISSAICELVRMTQDPGQRDAVRNFYPEVVTDSGNENAMRIIDKYFEPCDALWRGLGRLPGSGFCLRDEFRDYYAAPAGGGLDKNDTGFDYDGGIPVGCSCSEVITGRILPTDCAMFGTRCNPMDPLGPCMVSAEGACGIWYQFNKNPE